MTSVFPRKKCPGIFSLTLLIEIYLLREFQISLLSRFWKTSERKSLGDKFHLISSLSIGRYWIDAFDCSPINKWNHWKKRNIFFLSFFIIKFLLNSITMTCKCKRKKHLTTWRTVVGRKKSLLECDYKLFWPWRGKIINWILFIHSSFFLFPSRLINLNYSLLTISLNKWLKNLLMNPK